MSNSKPVRILMSAINGYGFYYLKTLREEMPDSEALLVGVVDPEARKSGHYPWIVENEIPVFDRMEDFYRDDRSADLAVISSPPQYHVSQSIVALEKGSHVLVDKPVGVNTESVRELIAASDRYRRWVEVGYQWSFSNAIQSLKRDILDAKYGQPVRFKTICLWPRDKKYFNRNTWAGRIEDSKGRLVLDSPANNACAHFLHNLVFLGGDKVDSSAVPVKIECLKFRAYDIQNYDTISLRIESQNGVEIYFYASHVTEGNRNPEFFLEFTEGTVSFGGLDSQIVGTQRNGEIINYGSPDDQQFKKLFDAIRRVRENGPPVCPPEAALAQTICIDAIHESKTSIVDFPRELIVDEDNRRWVQGLEEEMGKAYERNILNLCPPLPGACDRRRGAGGEAN